MYIDTHAHIYDEAFDNNRKECIENALKAGVELIYMPNCDQYTIPRILQAEEEFSGSCIPMMGLHPCYVKEQVAEELDIVRSWLEKRKFAAIGEIGLDYHWDLTYQQAQLDAFETQLHWALEFDLPVVLHSRKSTGDCIEMIRKHQDGRLKGIFHCFSGTIDEALQIRDLGFLLGIGGVVTYKNGGLEPVIQAVGSGSLVLETDAPYLAPVPFRGKRNEPAYLPGIAERVAAILETEVERIRKITTENALRLFSI